jgi:sulfur relay (sulfurtransferase) DsrC/TusE family protein
MNTVYNEEEIIKYVQNYYNKYNISPKITEDLTKNL